LTGNACEYNSAEAELLAMYMHLYSLMDPEACFLNFVLPGICHLVWFVCI